MRARQLIVFASLMAAFSVAGADTLERPTLADFPPAYIPEEGLEISRLVEQGQQASETMEFQAAAQAYCTAARLGDADAQYRLGRLLLQQRSVKHAQAQALFVLKLAADQGHEEARQYFKDAGLIASITPERPRCLPPPAQALAATGSGWLPASFDPEAPAVSAEVVKRYLKQLDQERQSWAQRLQERAPYYGIDPKLAVSIVRAESNFDPRALSSANAHGLMQLIPATAERFGVSNVQDPSQNIEGGLAYLRWLLNRFNHDVVKTTAAYNAGEGAVEKFKGVPPYPETQAYVERILKFYRAVHHIAPPVPKARRVVKSPLPPRG